VRHARRRRASPFETQETPLVSQTGEVSARMASILADSLATDRSQRWQAFELTQQCQSEVSHVGD
jgi:hypothetical protein